MKNEFISKLQNDEKIIFYGTLNGSKTSKQYIRFLLGFIALIIFWILAIIGVKSEGLLNFNILIILVILSIITICLIYGLIYNVFLKAKNKNDEYFVTNKRIALYSSKYDFKIKNISEIEHIGIFRKKTIMEI